MISANMHTPLAVKGQISDHGGISIMFGCVDITVVVYYIYDVFPGCCLDRVMYIENHLDMVSSLRFLKIWYVFFIC